MAFHPLAPVKIEFNIKATLQDNERLFVVGNEPFLGSWRPSSGVELKAALEPSEQMTSGAILVPPTSAGKELQYRYVVVTKDTQGGMSYRYEETSLRVFQAKAAGLHRREDGCFSEAPRCGAQPAKTTSGGVGAPAKEGSTGGTSPDAVRTRQDEPVFWAAVKDLKQEVQQMRSELMHVKGERERKDTSTDVDAQRELRIVQRELDDVKDRLMLVEDWIAARDREQ